MTAISMDGATTAASDPAPDGALAAPENHATLCGRPPTRKPH